MNLGHPLFLRASASCSKILNDIKYFNRVKNSRETLPFRASASCSKLLNVCSENFQGNCVFFRASTSCSKILNDKKYIFNTEEKFQCNSVFHAQAQLAQNSECEKYVPYSGKFQGKLCFSGQAQVAQKSWIIKNIFNTVKNFRGNCFQGKRKLLKILNVKSIFNTVKNFRATLFFQGKRKLLKNRERWKNFQYSVYSLGGHPCSSG